MSLNGGFKSPAHKRFRSYGADCSNVRTDVLQASKGQSEFNCSSCCRNSTSNGCVTLFLMKALHCDFCSLINVFECESKGECDAISRKIIAELTGAADHLLSAIDSCLSQGRG
jgi:hypothetical protein